MNILLINHYAGSKYYGMEYRPFYLAREWVRLGHNVAIVAGSFSHVRNLNPSVDDNYCEEIIDGVKYVWLKTPYYQGNNSKRVWNIFTFIKRLYQYRSSLVKDYMPDVVIASSTYPFDIFPARYIARSYRAKLIYEVHDLWPLSPIGLGGMSKWNPFIMLMQHAENFAYKSAHKVVSMLPRAKDYMQEHGMEPHKFNHVPNGVAVDEWEDSNQDLPNEHRNVIIDLKSSGKFLVGYLGSHGASNALHVLIHVARILRNEPVGFVLVGQGPEKENLRRKAMECGLNNVAFLPPVSKATVQTLLNCMDVLFIGWLGLKLYRFGVSPNKLMDYMMAAKPVIHAIETGNDMVAESDCGISVPAEDPKAIADAVLKIMDMSSQEREEMGMRGRKYVMEHHDYKVLAKRFLEVMES